ncbi:MAG: hypothetical protein ACYCWN_08850 [Ferrimicrobium sp.]|jgi:hypothetical protein|uniref:Sec-independent protein translocase protein TatA n=1 Tax=Ferrimicrobium acidiphilum TaxID=121039 RepID=A0ABV3Y3C6_9ACTN|nr:hypothetical protein [Ferrimicrobium sp.]MCL5972863.1 hypothetical protein [Actinomycetota bacterium]
MTELLYVLIPIGFVVIVGVLGSLRRVKPVSIDEGIRSFDSLRQALDQRHRAESPSGPRAPRS